MFLTFVPIPGRELLKSLEFVFIRNTFQPQLGLCQWDDFWKTPTDGYWGNQPCDCRIEISVPSPWPSGREEGLEVESITNTQSCLTFCNPMNCNMPGFPVLHNLAEFGQTHFYWISNAIIPPHPLLSPSPPAFYLSQYLGLFLWVGSSQQVVKVLELQLQHLSFQWIFRVDFL